MYEALVRGRDETACVRSTERVSQVLIATLVLPRVLSAGLRRLRKPAAPSTPRATHASSSMYETCRLLIGVFGLVTCLSAALVPRVSLFHRLAPPRSWYDALLPIWRAPLGAHMPSTGHRSSPAENVTADLRTPTAELARRYGMLTGAKGLSDDDAALLSSLQTFESRLSYARFGPASLLSCRGWVRQSSDMDGLVCIAPDVMHAYLWMCVLVGLLTLDRHRPVRYWSLVALATAAIGELFVRLRYGGELLFLVSQSFITGDELLTMSTDVRPLRCGAQRRLRHARQRRLVLWSQRHGRRVSLDMGKANACSYRAERRAKYRALACGVAGTHCDAHSTPRECGYLLAREATRLCSGKGEQRCAAAA